MVPNSIESSDESPKVMVPVVRNSVPVGFEIVPPFLKLMFPASEVSVNVFISTVSLNVVLFAFVISKELDFTRLVKFTVPACVILIAGVAVCPIIPATEIVFSGLSGVENVIGCAPSIVESKVILSAVSVSKLLFPRVTAP